MRWRGRHGRTGARAGRSVRANSALSGTIQRRRCLRREAFFATKEAHALGRGGFHADPFKRQTKHVGCPRAHALAMGADLGALTDQSDVDMLDARTCGFREVHGMAQETLAIGAFPLRVGGWEMYADIAFAKGAENGVDQSMPTRVRIGVAKHALVMSDPHAAERDVIAIAEAMRVDAVADTGDAVADQALQHSEILVRSFHQVQTKTNFTTSRPRFQIARIPSDPLIQLRQGPGKVIHGC